MTEADEPRELRVSVADVEAAKLRVDGDRRLGRTTPEFVVRVAEAGRARPDGSVISPRTQRSRLDRPHTDYFWMPTTSDSKDLTRGDRAEIAKVIRKNTKSWGPPVDHLDVDLGHGRSVTLTLVGTKKGRTAKPSHFVRNAQRRYTRII